MSAVWVDEMYSWVQKIKPRWWMWKAKRNIVDKNQNYWSFRTVLIAQLGKRANVWPENPWERNYFTRLKLWNRLIMHYTPTSFRLGAIFIQNLSTCENSFNFRDIIRIIFLRFQNFNGFVVKFELFSLKDVRNEQT